jgi:predicted thioesterase
MRPSLQAGLSYTSTYTVPLEKTVPYIYRVAADFFQQMPEVFAMGFMAVLCVWA